MPQTKPRPTVALIKGNRTNAATEAPMYDHGEAELLDWARTLKVNPNVLRADGAFFYYHSDAVAAIEKGFRKSRMAGWKAIKAVLIEYHASAYDAGLDDGQRMVARFVND